jgi:hypothetical protein
MPVSSSLSDIRRRRLAVEQLLREQLSPQLAAMYRYAADLLERREPEVWPSMAAHCCRELMNRLADYIEVPTLDPAARSGRRSEPVKIAQTLKDALAEQDPAALAAAAEEIIEAVAAGTAATAARAESIFRAYATAEPSAGELEAAIRAWGGLQNIFHGLAHLRSRDAPPVDEDALLAAFDRLTAILAARLEAEPFFDSHDALLQTAALENPTRRQVEQALAELRPSLTGAFYSTIKSPKWIAHLRQARVFAVPPALTRQGDTVQFPRWPAGELLADMAPHAPEDVGKAAMAIPASDNATVAEIVGLVALGLPVGDDTVVLSKRVSEDLRSEGSQGMRRLPDLAGQLAERLASGGRVKAAEKLYRALLDFTVQRRPSGSDIFPDFVDLHPRIDPWRYREIAVERLPALKAVDPMRVICLLASQLIAAERAYSTARPGGSSTAWRPAVEDHSQNSIGDDPREVLLELLRDNAIDVINTDRALTDQVLAELSRSDRSILRRLVLHLLTVIDGIEPERQAAALMDRKNLWDREVQHEFFHLLREAWDVLQAPLKRRLLSRIDDGPDPNELGVEAKRVEALADKIQLWGLDRRRRHFVAIGAERLPDRQRQWLNEFEVRYGADPHPDFSMYHTGFIGPTSPKPSDDLADMDHEALIELLRDFRAPSHTFSASPEGLGRSLAEAVSKDPGQWLWLFDRVAELPALYARQLLFAIESAVRADRTIDDWTPILNASDWILTQPADPERPADFDDDHDHHPARRALAAMLEETLMRALPDLEHRQQIWGLIRSLADDPDPTEQREQEHSQDALTLGISTVRGEAAAAAIEYGRWLAVKTHGADGWDAFSFEEAPELREQLERLLDPAIEPSRGVRAIVGARLALLTLLDAGWVKGAIKDLFSPQDSPLSQAAWQSHISYGNPIAQLTELVGEQYLTAVDDLSHLAADAELDRYRAALAEDVALTWRDMPELIPGLGPRFFAAAPAADRARVIGFLGRALLPKSQIPAPEPVSLERHRHLWEERLNRLTDSDPELTEFGWWWRSARFRTPEDVARFARTAAANRGRIGDWKSTLDMLASIVTETPASLPASLDVLEALAGGHPDPRGSTFLEPPVRDILSRAVSNHETADNARRLINVLGELGMHGLRDLLQQDSDHLA